MRHFVRSAVARWPAYGVLAWALSIAILLSSGPTHAAPEAGSPALKRALPELPEVPKRERKPPSPEQLEELDGHLSRFRSKDPHVRQVALRELLETSRSLIPAIDQRLTELATGSDRDAMKRLLSSLRRKARSAEREKMRAEGKKGKVTTPDYLELVVEFARPEDKIWQALVGVLCMSRMLVQIGSVEATRELIDIYVRFGEFLRVDVQLQLEKMGD
ncbi:MAG TPA: hypothetical protein PKD61_27335, partial [Polyangiaceae bacterium]|nr:hypothetical protein [Polyangiaceae bacterium]